MVSLLAFIKSVILFLINVIFDLFLFIVLLRLLLQIIQAKFFNPVSQFVVRLTNPLVKPLHAIIPSFKNFDVALVVLLVILEICKLLLIFLVVFTFPHFTKLIFWSLIILLKLVVNFYFFAVLLAAITSWLYKSYENPVIQILFSLTEPVLMPIRRFVPVIGGFDFSPIVALILLQVAVMALTFILAASGAPPVII